MAREQVLNKFAGRPRRLSWFGWLPLVVFPASALIVGPSLDPWVFMWILAFTIYAGLKWLTWWQAHARFRQPAWYSSAYLVGWPGMDAEAFLDSSASVPQPRLLDWIWASLDTAVGVILLWGVARRFPDLPLLQGWLGMLGLVLLLHFGTFTILALIWQSVGIRAVQIMHSPLLSRSLSDFWGRRWNLGFRQLSHDLIFRPLGKRLGAGGAGFLAFVLSGLIHDLVISVPARGGYGLPTLYFVLQGIGVSVERSRLGKTMGLRQGVRGWIFMAVFTAAPAFWLFHPPFVSNVILPLMRAIRAI